MSIEHVDIPEAGLHEPKGASTASSGETILSNGGGGTSWGSPQLAGQSSASTNELPFSNGAGSVNWREGVIDYSTVLTASSPSSQVPTGVDSELQLEFGAAQSNTFLSLASNGNITVLTDGIYRINFTARLTRTSAVGTAELMVRLLVDDVEIFEPVTFSLPDDNLSYTYSTFVEQELSIGQVLTAEIVRDSGGINNGSLEPFTTAVTGWSDSPSASIQFKYMTVG